LDHDAAAAYAWASPALFHDAAVQVPWTPKNLDAFVALVVALVALVGAFVEVQIGEVNAMGDATSILAAVRNYPVAPETVAAFRNYGTAAVDPAYPHCDVDDCMQGYSLDDPLASRLVEDSLAQHVQRAWNLASLLDQRRVGLAAGHLRRRTGPSWSCSATS
jgi:hypothetical protein